MAHFMTDEQRNAHYDALLAGKEPPPLPDVKHCAGCGETDNLNPCPVCQTQMLLCRGCMREDSER